MDTPITLKQLLSFMVFIHHLIKFTLYLATLSELLRSLLSKSNLKSRNRPNWLPHHTEAFEKTKEAFKNITESKLFDVNCPTRVDFDANRKGPRGMPKLVHKVSVPLDSICEPFPKYSRGTLQDQ